MKRLRIRRWIKVSGIIILAVAVLLLAFQQFLYMYVPKIIRSQITHLVVGGSDSLYTCSIGDISVDLFSGNVKIEDLNISIDSTRYEKLKQEKKLPGVTFKLDLETGMIKGLKLYPLILSKKTIIHSIIADNADISLSRENVSRHLKPKHTPSEHQLWKIVQPYIAGIYIERILLNDIKLSYKSVEKDKYIDFSYESCSASFRNIRIDSTGAQNSSRIFFTEELTVRATGIRYLTPDSIYLLKADTFTYCSFLKTLRLQGLSVHPNYSPEEITKMNGMQIDVIDADLPEIRVNNFKVERIVTNNEVNMDTVLVQDGLIKIHRDRTAHFDTTSQIGKFPLELLASAPVNIRVPLVIIDDMEVHYLEKQKKSHLIGDAGFYHVSGTVTNITNRPEDFKENDDCRIELKGQFMKDAKLEVNVNFDLASEDGKFSVKVDLGFMDASTLNELVIPFANVRMNGLIVHEGHFYLTGNKFGTVGQVRMRYENLKMEILKIDPGSGNIKTDAFISFMANMIAVRPNNPNGKNEVIAKNVIIVRKYRQPFSHIILETFVEGAKKVMVKVPANNIKVEM
jgi:hypothetical protein